MEFYWRLDQFQEPRLNDEELRQTLLVTLLKDRYVLCEDATGKLLGYVESWRITPDQFGRILLRQKFDVFQEDISNGPVCYVANTTIRPEYRKGWVYKELRDGFFDQNATAKWFVGEANRKRAQLVKVFSAEEFKKKWIPAHATADQAP